MKKKVTRKFKSGGLHEMHVVATWDKLDNLRWDKQIHIRLQQYTQDKYSLQNARNENK